ncbi:putative acyl-activating enzyme 17 [Nymphaea thermarum]|nr:putative acyl-activating enzyme 17 [Nymphaea thermarum]
MGSNDGLLNADHDKFMGNGRYVLDVAEDVHGKISTEQQLHSSRRDTCFTSLGTIPTVVKSWRSSNGMVEIDGSRIKAFGCTSESSNINNDLWLYSRAYGRPIIEYDDGTKPAPSVQGSLLQPPTLGAWHTTSIFVDYISFTGRVNIVSPFHQMEKRDIEPCNVFNITFLALDSVEMRNYNMAEAHNFTKYDTQSRPCEETVKDKVKGGTESLKDQVQGTDWKQV